MNNKKLYCAAFFLFTVLMLKAQHIFIPHFESTNTFYGIDTKPYIRASSISSLKLRVMFSPICYADMNIHADIEQLLQFFSPIDGRETAGEFHFFGGSLNFPHIKNKLFAISIFTGLYDYLGSDALLQEHIKAKMSEPAFRTKYPASAFKPQNTISGTGIAVHGAAKTGFYSGLYAYWNQKLSEEMQIKTDIRFGGNFDFFSFDLFAGAAVPKNIKSTELRTGITMLFTADDYYDFFLEAGIGKIKIEKPVIETFVSNFYALFEARIKKEKINAAIACFVSPVFLLPSGIMDTTLKDSFFAGLNTTLTFGSIYFYNVEGGFSVLASVNPKKPALITPFSFSVSPFISFKINRLEFDLRFPINPLMYKNIKQMFTGQFSVKAVF